MAVGLQQWWANPNHDWNLNCDLNTFGEWFDSLKIRFGSWWLGFNRFCIFCDSIWATRFNSRIIAGCYSSVLFSIYWDLRMKDLGFLCKTGIWDLPITGLQPWAIFGKTTQFSYEICCHFMTKNEKCGPMPNVMAALPIGGALCLTP